jgi:plasmid stability protein
VSTARLTASLLAPKGAAEPLRDTYGTPLLDPILPARAAVASLRPGTAAASAAVEPAPAAMTRLSLALDSELARPLGILAAKRGRRVQALVREALASYLATHRGDCPCMGAAVPAAEGRGAAGCCMAAGTSWSEPA